MSFENPTRLRIGMNGNFNGRDYRVVGRSVLGETEDGDIYYWNEFNLETDSGDHATLVYEASDNGVQWRIFTLFDPEYPMTAEDAATKRVGARLNLTGDDVRVTFRSQSQVYYVEGKPPEGEEFGSEAEYFNAEAGSIMQVVSWTGDEVEFYNGVTLTRGMVASAFGLPQELSEPDDSSFSSYSGSSYGSGNYISGTTFAVVAVCVVVFFIAIFGRGFSWSSSHEAPAVVKLSAPARPFEIGATGKLFDKNYRVTAHAVVEIAEVGANWERHEYELTDDDVAKTLLICGDKPDDAEWTLYEAFVQIPPLTGPQAAAKKVGDLVQLDGRTSMVTEIFLSTIQQTDGTGLDGLNNGTVTYGFRSVSGYRPLLARWNDAGIQFFRGQTVTAKLGLVGFTSAK